MPQRTTIQVFPENGTPNFGNPAWPGLGSRIYKLGPSELNNRDGFPGHGNVSHWLCSEIVRPPCPPPKPRLPIHLAIFLFQPPHPPPRSGKTQTPLDEVWQISCPNPTPSRRLQPEAAQRVQHMLNQILTFKWGSPEIQGRAIRTTAYWGHRRAAPT